jgi:hypothetical protein
MSDQRQARATRVRFFYWISYDPIGKCATPNRTISTWHHQSWAITFSLQIILWSLGVYDATYFLWDQGWRTFSPIVSDDDEENKPVWPTWAVGALFWGLRRIHINHVINHILNIVWLMICLFYCILYVLFCCIFYGVLYGLLSAFII